MTACVRCSLVLAGAIAVALLATGTVRAATEIPQPGEGATPDPVPTPGRAPGSSPRSTASDRLLLTGGVTQIEGAAGGGLVPWAVIGGYGTRDQIGASAFYTHVGLQDYHLDDAGVLVGFHDRVEVSFAQQRFDTQDVGAALGLGRGFTLRMDTIGVKLKLAGDAVLEQSSWLPQIAVGLQYKRNDEGGARGLLKAIGARSTSGTDVYVSATKLFLGQGLLLDATVRLTRANQIGILGFDGERNGGYRPEFEGSAALLLSRDVVVGAEYRMKPDNLGIAREDDWYDAFVAWAPTKHVSFTLAYAWLGNVVVESDQHGPYASLQVGF